MSATVRTERYPDGWYVVRWTAAEGMDGVWECVAGPFAADSSELQAALEAAEAADAARPPPQASGAELLASLHEALPGLQTEERQREFLATLGFTPPARPSVHIATLGAIADALPTDPAFEAATDARLSAREKPGARAMSADAKAELARLRTLDSRWRECVRAALDARDKTQWGYAWAALTELAEEPPEKLARMLAEGDAVPLATCPECERLRARIADDERRLDDAWRTALDLGTEHQQTLASLGAQKAANVALCEDVGRNYTARISADTEIDELRSALDKQRSVTIAQWHEWVAAQRKIARSQSIDEYNVARAELAALADPERLTRATELTYEQVFGHPITEPVMTALAGKDGAP